MHDVPALKLFWMRLVVTPAFHLAWRGDAHFVRKQAFDGIGNLRCLDRVGSQKPAFDCPLTEQFLHSRNFEIRPSAGLDLDAVDQDPHGRTGSFARV